MSGLLESNDPTSVPTSTSGEEEEEGTSTAAGTSTGVIPEHINLGPLTTTFERPAESTGCATLRFNQDLTTMASIAYGLGCDFQVDPDCYPGVYGQVYNDERNRNIDAAYQPAVFSPGNMCPEGYVTACSYTRVAGEDKSRASEWESIWSRATTTITGNIWDYIQDGETAIGCCPSGYECPATSPTLCYSVVPSETISVVSYESACASTTFAFSFDSEQASDLYTRTSTEVNRFGIVAHAPRVVLVQWDDVSTSTSGSGTSDPTESGARNTNTGESQPGGESGSDGGLSGGAKIAIGLGVAMPMIAVIAAGFFLFWFIRRRRARKAAAAEAEAAGAEGGDAAGGSPENGDFKAELHGTSGGTTLGAAGAPFAKPELDSSAVQEMGGDGMVKSELDGAAVRELHGGVVTPSELGTDRTVVAELPDSQAGHTGSVTSGTVASEARGRDHATTGLWDWSQPLGNGVSPAVSPAPTAARSPGLDTAVSPDEEGPEGRRR